jgi:hypothetical protein
VGEGLKVRAVPIDDLILMMRAACRTKDLMRIEGLAVSGVELGDGWLVASGILSVPTRTIF